MSSLPMETLIAPAGAGRLDLYLTAAYPSLSRSRVQELIRSGAVTVDGAQVKTGFSLRGGERICLCVTEAEPVSLRAQDIPLDVVYEDGDIIVVNKPQGMVVHPSVGHREDTLVNALLNHCGDLSGINGEIRPGVVHRIDKDTSGLLVAAKNDRAHLGLTKQWQGHHIKRVYHAILWGLVGESSGLIDAPIGRHPRDRKKMAVEPLHGRNAITHYQVIERLPLSKTTYAQLTLETGRTHQIRVHLTHLGYPVVGDPVYGPKKQAYPQLQGQALHAKILGFHHPLSNEYLEFDSPLPDYFSRLLDEMRRGER